MFSGLRIASYKATKKGHLYFHCFDKSQMYRYLRLAVEVVPIEFRRNAKFFKSGVPFLRTSKQKVLYV